MSGIPSPIDDFEPDAQAQTAKTSSESTEEVASFAEPDFIATAFNDIFTRLEKTSVPHHKLQEEFLVHTSFLPEQVKAHCMHDAGIFEKLLDSKLFAILLWIHNVPIENCLDATHELDVFSHLLIEHQYGALYQLKFGALDADIEEKTRRLNDPLYRKAYANLLELTHVLMAEQAHESRPRTDRMLQEIDCHSDLQVKEEFGMQETQERSETAEKAEISYLLSTFAAAISSFTQFLRARPELGVFCLEQDEEILINRYLHLIVKMIRYHAMRTLQFADCPSYIRAVEVSRRTFFYLPDYFKTDLKETDVKKTEESLSDVLNSNCVAHLFVLHALTALPLDGDSQSVSKIHQFTTVLLTHFPHSNIQCYAWDFEFHHFFKVMQTISLLSQSGVSFFHNIQTSIAFQITQTSLDLFQTVQVYVKKTKAEKQKDSIELIQRVIFFISKTMALIVKTRGQVSALGPDEASAALDQDSASEANFIPEKILLSYLFFLIRILFQSELSIPQAALLIQNLLKTLDPRLESKESLPIHFPIDPDIAITVANYLYTLAHLKKIRAAPRESATLVPVTDINKAIVDFFRMLNQHGQGELFWYNDNNPVFQTFIHSIYLRKNLALLYELLLREFDKTPELRRFLVDAYGDHQENLSIIAWSAQVLNQSIRDASFLSDLYPIIAFLTNLFEIFCKRNYSEFFIMCTQDPEIAVAKSILESIRILSVKYTVWKTTIRADRLSVIQRSLFYICRLFKRIVGIDPLTELLREDGPYSDHNPPPFARMLTILHISRNTPQEACTILLFLTKLVYHPLFVNFFKTTLDSSPAALAHLSEYCNQFRPAMVRLEDFLMINSLWGFRIAAVICYLDFVERNEHIKAVFTQEGINLLALRKFSFQCLETMRGQENFEMFYDDSIKVLETFEPLLLKSSNRDVELLKTGRPLIFDVALTAPPKTKKISPDQSGQAAKKAEKLARQLQDEENQELQKAKAKKAKKEAQAKKEAEQIKADREKAARARAQKEQAEQEKKAAIKPGNQKAPPPPQGSSSSSRDKEEKPKKIVASPPKLVEPTPMATVAVPELAAVPKGPNARSKRAAERAAKFRGKHTANETDLSGFLDSQDAEDVLPARPSPQALLSHECEQQRAQKEEMTEAASPSLSSTASTATPESTGSPSLTSSQPCTLKTQASSLSEKAARFIPRAIIMHASEIFTLSSNLMIQARILLVVHALSLTPVFRETLERTCDILRRLSAECCAIDRTLESPLDIRFPKEPASPLSTTEAAQFWEKQLAHCQIELEQQAIMITQDPILSASLHSILTFMRDHVINGGLALQYYCPLNTLYLSQSHAGLLKRFISTLFAHGFSTYIYGSHFWRPHSQTLLHDIDMTVIYERDDVSKGTGMKCLSSLEKKLNQAILSVFPRAIIEAQQAILDTHHPAEDTQTEKHLFQSIIVNIEGLPMLDITLRTHKTNQEEIYQNLLKNNTTVSAIGYAPVYEQDDASPLLEGCFMLTPSVARNRMTDTPPQLDFTHGPYFTEEDTIASAGLLLRMMIKFSPHLLQGLLILSADPIKVLQNLMAEQSQQRLALAAAIYAARHLPKYVKLDDAGPINLRTVSIGELLDRLHMTRLVTPPVQYTLPFAMAEASKPRNHTARAARGGDLEGNGTVNPLKD